MSWLVDMFMSAVSWTKEVFAQQVKCPPFPSEKYRSHSVQIVAALCKGPQGRRSQRKTHIWCRRLRGSSGDKWVWESASPKTSHPKDIFQCKVFFFLEIFPSLLKLFLPSLLAQLATQEPWAFPRKPSLWLPTGCLLANLLFWYLKFFPWISGLCETFGLLQKFPWVENLWNNPDISIRAISMRNLSVFLRGDLRFADIAQVLGAIHKGTNSKFFDLCQSLWTEEYQMTGDILSIGKYESLTVNVTFN